MRNAILSGLLLLGAACAPVHVTIHALPGSDVSRFETYAQATPTAGADAAIAAQVRSEIDQELQARGYRPAPLDEADMVVSFQGRSASRARYANAGDPDANYYVVRNYTEGTLEIDVFEPGTQTPVWRGVGRADLYSERELQKAADRAVRAILAEFPRAGGTPPD